MTRVKLSILMIIAMICASIFSGIWVSGQCRQLSERAERIFISYKNNDRQTALAEAEMLEKEWEDMRKKASVLLKFDKLSEIDRIVSHTCVLVSNGSEDVQPQMAELIHMLDILRKSEMP